MERSSTSKNYYIEEDLANIEELINLTLKSVSDLEKLRNEYHGFMPDIIREEYDELKTKLKKLREIHNQLINSSNVSRDSNGVSPRKALVEVAELSGNLNDSSMANSNLIENNSEAVISNQQISSNNKKSIISGVAYNRASHSLDYNQNNGWFEHKNKLIKDNQDRYGRFSQNNSEKTNDSGRITMENNINSMTSLNVSSREFVVIQIPPKLTYKLRVTNQEDMHSVFEPYFKNLNINIENIVVVDVKTKKIINLKDPSIEYSKKILKVYYKSLTNKIVPKFHILSKKFFVATKNCAICKSLIINGLKCVQCLLSFHKKCYCKKPTLCDPDISSNNQDNNNNNVDNNQDISDQHKEFNNIRNSQSSKSNIIKSELIYPNLCNFQHVAKPNGEKPNVSTSLDVANPKYKKMYQISNYCTLNKKKWPHKMSDMALNIISDKTEKDPNSNSELKNALKNKIYKNISYQQLNKFNNNFSSLSTKNESEFFGDAFNSLDQDITTSNISIDEKSFPYGTTTRPRRRVGRVKPVTDNLSLPWYIDNREVEIEEKIGVGSFGTVYKGFWHGNVAVKFLNVNCPNEEQLITFKNEVAILRKTRHNNILLFVGCIYTPRLAIVTQWCDGSSLYNFIHVVEQQFKLAQLVNVAIQTCDGMDYLHAKNIIHRDLKSNNLFLQNSVVKIGDFGLSMVKRRGFSDSSNKQPTGSILWMAPEVIRMDSNDPCTVFSDVYSFGIVLFELLSCKLPYSHIKFKDQILYMVGKGKLTPDTSLLLVKYGRYLKSVYLDCINFTPTERPFFSTIAANLKIYREKLPKISRTTSTKEFRSSLGSNVHSFDELI